MLWGRPFFSPYKGPEQGLSSELLGRIAALGASLRLTLYAERKDSAQLGGETMTRKQPRRSRLDPFE